MKRLVLCFDGTWNAVDDPATVTNVVKFAQAIKPTASDGTKQIVYYNSGVGSGGKIDRILGGVFGFGLQGNVKRGLAFLSLNYEGSLDSAGKPRKVYRNDLDYDDGDEVYLFGFSRGAYTARALSAVIGGAGIPTQMDFHELEKVWNYYRLKPKLRPELVEEVRSHAWHPRVKCIGVWDTVGSYGIPSGFGPGALARALVSWTRGFHDREFGKHIDVGLHAMAVDEMRRPFKPTMWMRRKDDAPLDAAVEQVWFAGAHSNVGGGYAHCGLSDLALTWMIARVERSHDAGVRRERDSQAAVAMLGLHALSLQSRLAAQALRSRRAGGIGGQAQVPAMAQEGSRQRGHQREGALERHRAPGLRRSPGRGIEERKVRPGRPG